MRDVNIDLGPLICGTKVNPERTWVQGSQVNVNRRGHYTCSRCTWGHTKREIRGMEDELIVVPDDNWLPLALMVSRSCLIKFGYIVQISSSCSLGSSSNTT